jgi:aspartyl-tRNA(Asn)/glutamyl-tRNA(Gln) amidotransferase subunit C
MTEEELVNLASQFGSILDAVARVQELNLEGVKATSHPQPIENIFREDQVQPSLTPEQALSGAPAQEDQRFRVPQILGEAE